MRTGSTRVFPTGERIAACKLRARGWKVGFHLSTSNNRRTTAPRLADGGTKCGTVHGVVIMGGGGGGEKRWAASGYEDGWREGVAARCCAAWDPGPGAPQTPRTWSAQSQSWTICSLPSLTMVRICRLLAAVMEAAGGPLLVLEHFVTRGHKRSVKRPHEQNKTYVTKQQICVTPYGPVRLGCGRCRIK